MTVLASMNWGNVFWFVTLFTGTCVGLYCLGGRRK